MKLEKEEKEKISINLTEEQISTLIIEVRQSAFDFKKKIKQYAKLEQNERNLYWTNYCFEKLEQLNEIENQLCEQRNENKRIN